MSKENYDYFGTFLETMRVEDAMIPDNRIPLDEQTVSKAEFAALENKVEGLFVAVQTLTKTIEGIQQWLGKAAEYQGKPRGRLPR